MKLIKQLGSSGFLIAILVSLPILCMDRPPRLVSGREKLEEIKKRVNFADIQLHGELFYGTTVEKIQQLISQGAEVDGTTMEGRWTPLQHAVAQGNFEVAQVLIEAGANVNARIATDDRWTPLHMAAICGHEKIIELLISRGAFVNISSCSHRTPLDEAFLNYQLASARVLIRFGADFDRKDARVVQMVRAAFENEPLTRAVVLRDETHIINQIQVSGEWRDLEEAFMYAVAQNPSQFFVFFEKLKPAGSCTLFHDGFLLGLLEHAVLVGQSSCALEIIQWMREEGTLMINEEETMIDDATISSIRAKFKIVSDNAQVIKNELANPDGGLDHAVQGYQACKDIRSLILGALQANQRQSPGFLERVMQFEGPAAHVCLFLAVVSFGAFAKRGL